MKITVIAAVGAALLGIFPYQPAIAKGSDVPAAKRQISNVKQDVKAKAKKPVLPAKTAKKKPAVKAKPALAKAPAKDAKPSEASSAKPGPASVAVKQSTGNAASAPAKPVPLENEVAKNDAASGLPPSVQTNGPNSEQSEITPIASTIAPCEEEAEAGSLTGSQNSAVAAERCKTQGLNSPAEPADAKSQPNPVKQPGKPNLVTFVGQPSVAPLRQSGEIHGSSQ
jgi:hypothetical protein